MKRFSKTSLGSFLSKYWPLLIGAALLLFGVGGLVMSQPAHGQSREGGYRSVGQRAIGTATTVQV